MDVQLPSVRPIGGIMTCLSCQSVKQAELTAEMLIHFPGLKNIEKRGVLLFSNLTVCLDCGFSRFTVPETKLASVAEGTLPDKSNTLEEGDGDAAIGSEAAF